MKNKKIFYPDFNEKEISAKNKVVALGKFETLHEAHIFLLDKAKRIANEKEFDLVMMLFSEKKNNNFYSLDERIKLINSYNYNINYFLIFDPITSNLNSTFEEFNIFLKKINVTDIVIGEDFKYGFKKMGSSKTLEKNFNVHVISLMNNNNLKISTSRIFSLLKKENLKELKKILNRNFSYEGKVIRGLGNGKKFGMPTANVEYPKWKIDVNEGIYFSFVIYNGKKFPSLTSISKNPTLNAKKKTYETFIYNFSKDIYGENLCVELIEKFRNPMKFDSINELIKKLKEDKKIGEKYFNLR